MLKRRLYFDYAASTPVAPEVEAAMRPYFLNKFGNAGSLHSFGQEAIAALDESREIIAKAIGAPPASGFREVIFTGSATEANNLALRGATEAFRVQGVGYSNGKNSLNAKRYTLNPRIIVSAIEHESVLETARELEKDGVEVIYLPVSEKGIVDLKKLKESLNERTILVSVMYANNEIGTIQPIAEIAEIIKAFRVERSGHSGEKKSLNAERYTLYPLLHTDAVQAFQFLDCDVNPPPGGLGVDMMTISAHKIYGPKGVGALYMRQGSSVKNQGFRAIQKSKIVTHDACGLTPIITGGGQEFGLRSGTENIPLVVGFAKAVELAVKLREKESKRIAKLRDSLWNGLKKIYPKAEVNGQPADILPNFLNVYFPDHKAEDLLTRFDLASLAVSAGSACSARSAEPSYVIKAIDSKMKRAGHSIRFSLGRPTSKKDVDTALKIIRESLYR